MSRQKIKLVVTDFDNTLYDWFEGWYAYFNKLLDNLHNATGIDRQKLKKEIRAVHQEYGTSEYSHLLDELRNAFSEGKIAHDNSTYSKILEEAFLAKNQVLKLYETVLPTLLHIKESGTKIAVYTESQPLYSVDRLVKLGLDGVVDTLYAPLTREGLGIKNSAYNSLPFSRRESSEHTIVKNLPKDDIKPNPKVLLDIISDFGVSINEVVYVGDSKMKDICMANNAGVTSVLVNFGISSHKEAYKLLQEVSHWSDKDVEREMNMVKYDCVPNIELHKEYSELLENFEFISFTN